MSRSLLWAHAYRRINPNDRLKNTGFSPNTGQPTYPINSKLDRCAPADRSSPMAE